MIICQTCDYENISLTEFCEACGSELIAASIETNSDAQIPQISVPSIDDSQQPVKSGSMSTSIKLISKQAGASVSEFVIHDPNAIVGRFDPDSGPVDVDLEGFSGEETVSRNHAEIYYELGQWKVKDIGSTNGVFIKRSGQPRFDARITIPEILNFGDEVAFGKIRFLFQTL